MRFAAWRRADALGRQSAGRRSAEAVAGIAEDSRAGNSGCTANGAATVGRGARSGGDPQRETHYDATAPGQLADASQTGVNTANGSEQQTSCLRHAPDPLTGSITLDALKLSGGSLSQPIQIAKVVFEPAVGTGGQGSAGGDGNIACRSTHAAGVHSAPDAERIPGDGAGSGSDRARFDSLLMPRD